MVLQRLAELMEAPYRRAHPLDDRAGLAAVDLDVVLRAAVRKELPGDDEREGSPSGQLERRRTRLDAPVEFTKCVGHDLVGACDRSSPTART